jgi:ribosome biogenesis GTPase
MTLSDIGYNDFFHEHVVKNGSDGLSVGRIISEQKDRYLVISTDGVFEAEINGAMRFSATSREDLPGVGDWVLCSLLDNDFGIITSILPRQSIIRRRAPGKKNDIQIIGTNIDYAIIMQSADGNFNLNRIDRYLSICNDPNIQSIVVITKIDMVEASKAEDIFKSLQSRLHTIPVILLSNETLVGVEELKSYLLKGRTYCLLGSSGVGKSTLVNLLSEKSLMKTNEISDRTNKGKHTTSHRELIILDSGGILIDNPGMREVGIVDSNYGLGESFDRIGEIAEYCKFADCSHTTETGCAVLRAVENGELEKEVYANYIKLEKEQEYFSLSRAEHRRKDKKFGKMLKNYTRDKKSGKY